jgi:hypothetical protein
MYDEAEKTRARCACGQMVAGASKVIGESETTTVLKAMTITAATLVVASALGGLFVPAAVRAGEYCSEYGYTATRNCSYSSVQRCKAAISTTYAACLREPVLKDDSIETINTARTPICSAVPSRAIASGAAGRQCRQVEQSIQMQSQR